MIEEGGNTMPLLIPVVVPIVPSLSTFFICFFIFLPSMVARFDPFVLEVEHGGYWKLSMIGRTFSGPQLSLSKPDGTVDVVKVPDVFRLELSVNRMLVVGLSTTVGPDARPSEPFVRVRGVLVEPSADVF